MKQIDYKMNDFIETDLLSSYINEHEESHLPLALVFGYSRRAYNQD
jgi:hypothetical protein